MEFILVQGGYVWDSGTDTCCMHIRNGTIFDAISEWKQFIRKHIAEPDDKKLLDVARKHFSRPTLKIYAVKNNHLQLLCKDDLVALISWNDVNH